MLLWFLAFVLTVALGYFQRVTGPSHPLRGTVEVDGETVEFKLLRSDEGRGVLPVRVAVPASVDSAALSWRRYPTEEPWQEIPMTRDGEAFASEVPVQPPAGKVEYQVLLDASSGRVAIPQTEAAVVRFRGDVPAGVLIPHILSMFLSMLFATGAFLLVLRGPESQADTPVLVAMGLLMVGGLALGPMVQKHAFDAYWTGWPYGTDLTDNKTLVAFLAWLPASILAVRGSTKKVAVVLGWVVMMGVFLIPHSMRGSEIDWSETGAGSAATSNPPSQ